ncbi:MAG: hypothetical protein HYY32_05385 [Chloroflexi bacterium]|nr:hypothetical protein [Chloroflexota bacterium]
MSVSTPEQLARVMKARKNVLVLAGSLCDEMELEGKKLGEYAADISVKLGAPVAATANSIAALRANGAKASKKLAIQLVEMLRYEGWRDPIMPERPELLLFIGYPKDVMKALASASTAVETVALCTSAIEEATHSLPAGSQRQFADELEAILKGLA